MPPGLQMMIVFTLFGATLFCLHSVADVFTPIFLALTLVLSIRPISRFLRKKHVPGWIACTVAFLALLILFGAIVSVLIWAFTPIPQTLINYSGNFEATLTSTLEFLESHGVKTADLALYLDQVNFNSVIAWVWSLIDSLRSVGGLLAIVVVALFFLTLDTTTMNVRHAIVEKNHSHIAYALMGFEKRVRHYWITSSIFGLIVAVIDVFALGLLGVPLAPTWGVWAFITNYIPNIGFVLGVIPPMLMGLVDSGWHTMIWVIVVYSVINVVIQTFIQPKFTGQVVGLSPSITFISLVLWTSVVGWLGSILAVPLTLFFKALLVDTDPRTQWLDAFLVSENDAKQRKKAGFYDNDAAGIAQEPEFRYPTDVFAQLAFLQLHGTEDARSTHKHRILRRRFTGVGNAHASAHGSHTEGEDPHNRAGASMYSEDTALSTPASEHSHKQPHIENDHNERETHASSSK